MKQFRLIASSLAHDMKTLYTRQLDSVDGVPKAAQHEDDHMVGEREEGDYEKENVGNDTENISPQHVHQVNEATTHIKDRGYENFDHFNKTPSALRGDQP